MAGNRKADYIHTAPWVIQAKLGMRDYSTNQVQPRTHTTNRKRDENGEKRHNFRQRHFALYRYIYHILYIFALPFFTNIINHLQPLVHFAAPYVPSLWLVNPSWRAFAAKSCVNAIFLPLKYIQSKSLPLFQLKLQLSVPAGRSCLSTGDSGFVIQSAIHVTCVFFAFCNMTLGSQEPVEFLDIGSFITKTVLRQLEYF